MPLIPRSEVGYQLYRDFDSLYTHALDRVTAILDQIIGSRFAVLEYKKLYMKK